jgi:hypothetical protein
VSHRVRFEDKADAESRTAGQWYESRRTGLGVGIDQLEEKGLVERADHPDDRRSLRVQLTAMGRGLHRGAHEAFLSRLEPLFAGRTAADRRQVLAFLSDTIRVIQRWRGHPRKVRRHGHEHSER